MNAKLALQIIMWHLHLSSAMFSGNDPHNTKRYWDLVFAGKLYLTHEVKVGPNDYAATHDYTTMRHQLVEAAAEYLAHRIDQTTLTPTP